MVSLACFSGRDVLNILATFVIKAVRSLRVRSILYLLRASMMFAIPSWALSVFAIQTLWCTIFVQMINLLPSFSPFGALIFVRLRAVWTKAQLLPEGRSDDGAMLSHRTSYIGKRIS